MGERNVVGVASHDHNVRDVGQAKHVLDNVDGQADVRPILRIHRRRKQLGQVDRPPNELLLVLRVRGCRPVGVRATEDDRSERGREIEHRTNVDRCPLEARLRLDIGGGCRAVEAADAIGLEAIEPVQLVVARDHDVVEVDVYRNTSVGRFSHEIPFRPVIVLLLEWRFARDRATRPRHPRRPQRRSQVVLRSRRRPS